MADKKDDAKEFATDFLKLWQKQLDCMMRDPDLMANTTTFLQGFNSFQFDETRKKTTDNPSDLDISNVYICKFRELERRIFELEGRITSMEQKLGCGSKIT